MNRDKVIKDIFSVLGVAGIITVAVLAPNALQIFGNQYVKGKRRTQLKRSLKSLERKDLVSIKEEEGKTTISLTKNGKRKILEFKANDMVIKKPKKWDKKWRLVIFDVPNSYSASRLTFTRKLKELGFKYMQKSVWIYPYPCENEVDFLKELYEIRPYVRIVTAESVDIQDDLIKKFDL